MPPLPATYAALAVAILFEVVGTTFLQKSAQFTRLVPTVLMGVCYLGAFYFMALTLRHMPVGVVYAIWSGVGIVCIALIGAVVFKQALDAAAVVGIGLIVAGVVVLNVFSDSIGH